MGAGVARQCSRNRCLDTADTLDPRSKRGGAAGRANSKKDLVTGTIRGFCALQGVASRREEASCGRDTVEHAAGTQNIQETGVSPGGRSGSPIVTAEAEQVERTRRKPWSRPRSDVFVPYRASEDTSEPLDANRSIGSDIAAFG
jgi:hypothetical protein